MTIEEIETEVVVEPPEASGAGAGGLDLETLREEILLVLRQELERQARRDDGR